MLGGGGIYLGANHRTCSEVGHVTRQQSQQSASCNNIQMAVLIRVAVVGVVVGSEATERLRPATITALFLSLCLSLSLSRLF